MIGRTLSHYRILAKLGEGGMGVVYQAEDLALGRRVALKFLPPATSTDPAARRRFLQEARASAALDHAGICTVHEVGEVDGQPYIAMALLEGRTLRDRVAAGPLPIPEALDTAAQVAEALREAHAKGVTHRDVKPANIMLTPQGQAKVMDFGLAQVAGATQVTQAGSALGTAAYMSPEQARGGAVDHRTDIWSLGVVLYEMVAGRRPFRADHTAALLHLIQHGAQEPLTGLRAGVPPELERIVAKCLERDPAERYQTAADLAADLRRLQRVTSAAEETTRWPQPPSAAGGRGAADRPAPRPAGALSWPARRMTLPAAAVLLAALAVAYALHGSARDATAGGKSVAVLPFADMSPSRDQEYFCDGLTVTLIDRLSRLEALKVSARTSAFAFKGKAHDAREIGRKLQVRAILEGSVQKSGDRLRITAQLVAAEDGFQLWSRTFDRGSKDIFAIQDEISTAIVDALELKLTSDERSRIAERPIDNVAAYECYLKANDKIWRFNEGALDSASRYLQDGLAIAGDNALLCSAMALVCWQYVNIGARQEDYVTRAVDYADRALTLDPDFPLAHYVLGSIYKDFLGNPQESIRHYRRALVANPREPDALRNLAYMCFTIIGRPEAGEPLRRRAEQVDPLDPWVHLCDGMRELYGGRYALALEPFQKLYEADPGNPMSRFYYSWALTLSGERDAALSLIDAGALEAPDNVLAKLGLLLKCGLRQDKEGGLRLLTPDFQKTCRRDPEWSYYVALMLARLEANDEALAWLENAVNRGFVNYPELGRNEALAALRGDARWGRLMTRVKSAWERIET